MKLPKGLVVRDGIFYIDIRVDGRRIKKSLRLGKDRCSEAIEIYNELKLKVSRAQLGVKPKNNPTLESLFENYLEYKRNMVLPTTLEQVRVWFKYLLDDTGVIYASDLTPEVLMDYLNKRAMAASNSARKTQFQVVAAFEYAESLGLIEKNLLKKTPRIKHEDDSWEPLSETQFMEFWKEISLYSCQYLVGFLMKTGARFGESANLKWRNVHLKSGYVVMIKENTKTKSRREIPLSADLVEMFESLKNPETTPDTFVFLNENGEKFKKDYVRRRVKKACANMGVYDFSTHALRTTFINLVFDHDANTFSVGNIVGHKNSSTTQIYVKGKRDRNRKVIDLMPHLNRNVV